MILQLTGAASPVSNSRPHSPTLTPRAKLHVQWVSETSSHRMLLPMPHREVGVASKSPVPHIARIPGVKKIRDLIPHGSTLTLARAATDFDAPNPIYQSVQQACFVRQPWNLSARSATALTVIQVAPLTTDHADKPSNAVCFFTACLVVSAWRS